MLEVRIHYLEHELLCQIKQVAFRICITLFSLTTLIYVIKSNFQMGKLQKNH